MASDKKILELLALLTEYYDKEPSEKQARVYLATLRDIDDDVLDQAVMDYIAKSQWFPKVNELRAMAKAVETNNNQTTQYRRELATQADLYWQAMGAFNAALAGRITETELVMTRGWLWYVVNKPAEPEQEDFILAAPVSAETLEV